MKNLKPIFIIFFLVITAVAVIGYYYYNKGPADIRLASAEKINAVDLYSIFDSDTTTSKKKYSGKIVEVTGQVKEVLVNQQGKPLILLNAENNAASINCTLENDEEVKPGQLVTIKGLCSGMGQGVPDLGLKGDVYLRRGLLIK